jgi:hypothetical protein
MGEMDELLVPRSMYALTHFVVGQHDTPGQQRRQVLAELKGMLFNLADSVDDARLLELDIQDLEGAKELDERGEINLARKKRHLRGAQITLRNQLAECDNLLKILNQIPKYTREELEAEEPEYWRRRLNRQHNLGQLGDFGNLDAQLMMRTEPGKTKPELPFPDELKIDQLVVAARQISAGKAASAAQLKEKN